VDEDDSIAGNMIATTMLQAASSQISIQKGSAAPETPQTNKCLKVVA
jgi:hypothetical protein